MFNHISTTSSFPNTQKSSLVIPVCKKAGGTGVVKNEWASLSKVFERLIKDSIDSFLFANSLCAGDRWGATRILFWYLETTCLFFAKIVQR